MRTYVNALGCGQRNSKRFGKKTHGTGLLEHTFAFYKDINMTGAQWWKRRKNYPGSEERFVLVMVMDPNRVNQSGEERQLCTRWLLNYINGTLLTDCTARKTDINIFKGRYAWSKWEYECEPCLCALSMFYQGCVTVFIRRIVYVSSQALTVTVCTGNKLSVEENI